MTTRHLLRLLAVLGLLLLAVGSRGGGAVAESTPSYWLYFPTIARIAPGSPDPLSLTYTLPGPMVARLQWSVSPQATGYRLWHQWNGAAPEVVAQLGAVEPLVTDQPVAYGSHVFWVQAYNAWGETASNSLSLFVATPTPTPTPIPSPTPSPTVPSGPPRRLDAIADAAVADGAPNTNVGTTIDMAVGYEECQFTSKLRSLVRFDLSAVPKDARIASVRLYLYLEESCAINGKSYPVTVYPVQGNWDERAVTWNNQPSVGLAITTVSLNGRDWGYHAWDVTTLVKDWIKGAQPNYGFGLRSLEYSGNDTASLYFYTREVSDASLRPYLEIQYVGQAAHEDSPPSRGGREIWPGGLRLRDELARPSAADGTDGLRELTGKRSACVAPAP